MFIDSRKIESDKCINTDVCVVGAGVSGLTLAREFENSGFETCIIESGGEKADKATQSLYWGENVGIPYYPLDTARARFLGGTSHYWVINLPENQLGVRLRPLDPIDFEEREWVPYSGWPFNKKHLDPYYERAHEVCGIGPYTYTPEDWKESNLREGLPWNSDRIYTTMFQFGDRAEFIEKHSKHIKRSNTIKVLLHGNAVDIVTDNSAREVVQINAACLNGNSFSIRARKYILATGGLETPRLLLSSNNSQRTGLGNQHDLVGRFFMEHPHLWCSAFIPSNVHVANSTGLYEIYRKNQTAVMGKIALTEHTLRKEKLLNWVTSIHPDYDLSYKKYLGYNEPGVLAVRSAKNVLAKKEPLQALKGHLVKALKNKKDIARYIFRTSKDHFKREFNRNEFRTVFRLNPMVEQAPNPDSRVLLGTEKDPLGLLRIHLDWQLTALDTFTITRAQEILDKELRKAGLGKLIIETDKDKIPKGIHGGWHHMGTTRMNTDPKKGVVDSNCRVHGVSNLYIGGASVFPTSGYANPVLTTIALVLRLADHIRDAMAK